jgi:CheY-like chemotaxis protein
MVGSAGLPSVHDGDSPARPHIRVLVVDDDTDTAVSTAKLFEFNGHVTQTAVSGPRALEHIVPFRPDLVLLDIQMRGMTGIEVAQTVRDMRLIKPPVLAAVSGHSLPYHKRQCAEAGFDHYLVKPVPLIEYEELVQFVTQASRARETFLSTRAAHKAAVYAFNWSQLDFCSLILDCVPHERREQIKQARLEKVKRTLAAVDAWLEGDFDAEEEQKYRIQLLLAELGSRLYVIERTL